MSVIILLLVAAVLLPTVALWVLLRANEQTVRVGGALLGGQILTTPAMAWIAWHEATPIDHDAWAAVLGVVIVALVVSAALTCALEYATKGRTE